MPIDFSKYKFDPTSVLTETGATQKPESVAIPLEEDESPYGKIQRALFSGLQKYGGTFTDPYRAQQTSEALTNVLGFVPGLADILDYQTGEYLIERGEKAKGLGLQTLASLPLIPAYKQFKPAVVEAFETGDIRTTGKGKRNYTPAKFTIEDSILNNKKFQKTYPNPDKPYQTKNMLELMRRYGSPSGLNTNVSEQIDKYISKELKNKDKVTVNEIIEDIDKNKPTFTVTRATYPGNVDQFQNAPRETGYVLNSPFIPKYKNPRDPKEAMSRKAPIQFDHKSFVYNPSATDESFNFENLVHREVSQGYMVSPPETRNKIFHTRQYTYDMDGQRVMVVAEGQSGAYRMSDKADEIELDVTDDAAYVGDVATDYGAEFILKSFDEVLPELGNLGVRNVFFDLFPSSASINPSVRQAYQTGAFDDVDFITTARNNLATTSDDTMRRYVNEIVEDLSDTGARVAPAVRTTPESVKVLREYFDNAITDAENRFNLFRMNNGVPNLGAMNAISLRSQEIRDKFYKDFAKSLGLNLDTKPDATKLPMFNQWFNVHMKSSLQDAANTKVDEVWFPINAEALARQRGENLVPRRAQDIMNEFDGDTMGTYSRAGTERDKPSTGAMEMAHKYKERTKKGLNAIEQDYGIKLQTETFMDENDQEFIKVIMTPELKEALSTLRLNRGGLVSLMPLRY
jgi:hypothetical protein